MSYKWSDTVSTPLYKDYFMNKSLFYDPTLVQLFMKEVLGSNHSFIHFVLMKSIFCCINILNNREFIYFRLMDSCSVSSLVLL